MLSARPIALLTAALTIPFALWRSRKTQSTRTELLSPKIYPYRTDLGSVCTLTHKSVKPLQFVNGKAYWDYPDRPLESKISYRSFPDGSAVNKGSIVILTTEEVIASPTTQLHCTLTQHQPVYFAGEYATDKNNNIIEITPNSGHYRPDNPESLKVAKSILKEKGLNTANIYFNSNLN